MSAKNSFLVGFIITGSSLGGFVRYLIFSTQSLCFCESFSASTTILRCVVVAGLLVESLLVSPTEHLTCPLEWVVLVFFDGVPLGLSKLSLCLLEAQDVCCWRAVCVLLSFVLSLFFFSATLPLVTCRYSNDIEATKSRIAWCLGLLPPTVISTSSDIVSPNLVKSSAYFSGPLLLCNTVDDKRDLSPLCVSDGEWRNLEALRKGYRKELSCWGSLAASVQAGEVAPITLPNDFLLFHLFNPIIF